MTKQWEMLIVSIGDRVRRLEVPGGWLYQVEIVSIDVESDQPVETWWGHPVFVADQGQVASTIEALQKLVMDSQKL